MTLGSVIFLKQRELHDGPPTECQNLLDGQLIESSELVVEVRGAVDSQLLIIEDTSLRVLLEVHAYAHCTWPAFDLRSVSESTGTSGSV